MAFETKRQSTDLQPLIGGKLSKYQTVPHVTGWSCLADHTHTEESDHHHPSIYPYNDDRLSWSLPDAEDATPVCSHVSLFSLIFAHLSLNRKIQLRVNKGSNALWTVRVSLVSVYDVRHILIQPYDDRNFTI